jgi:hypothetical protein
MLATAFWLLRHLGFMRWVISSYHHTKMSS